MIAFWAFLLLIGVIAVAVITQARREDLRKFEQIVSSLTRRIYNLEQQIKPPPETPETKPALDAGPGGGASNKGAGV